MKSSIDVVLFLLSLCLGFVIVIGLFGLDILRMGCPLFLSGVLSPTQLPIFRIWKLLKLF